MDEQDQIERDLRYLLEMKGELLMFVIFVQIFNICESHMFARRCRGNVTQLHPAQKILVLIRQSPNCVLAYGYRRWDKVHTSVQGRRKLRAAQIILDIILVSVIYDNGLFFSRLHVLLSEVLGDRDSIWSLRMCFTNSISFYGSAVGLLLVVDKFALCFAPHFCPYIFCCLKRLAVVAGEVLAT